MDNWDLLTDSLKEFHITLTNEQFHDNILLPSAAAFFY